MRVLRRKLSNNAFVLERDTRAQLNKNNIGFFERVTCYVKEATHEKGIFKVESVEFRCAYDMPRCITTTIITSSQISGNNFYEKTKKS